MLLLASFPYRTRLLLLLPPVCPDKVRPEPEPEPEPPLLIEEALVVLSSTDDDDGLCVIVVFVVLVVFVLGPTVAFCSRRRLFRLLCAW